jgi:hypothetical protein
MTQEELHIKYAQYILHESSTPVDEIEWLVGNLRPDAKTELEAFIKTDLS